MLLHEARNSYIICTLPQEYYFYGGKLVVLFFKTRIFIVVAKALTVCYSTLRYLTNGEKHLFAKLLEFPVIAISGQQSAQTKVAGLGMLP